MPVIPQVFPETLYFTVTIDGVGFPYATQGRLAHKTNKSRTFSCSFTGKEALEMCRVGAVVEVNWGRGNLRNLIDDKKFIGLIKSLNPSEKGSFVAFDYTTLLAKSQYIYYKAEDYIGQDLYFAAAGACDIDEDRNSWASRLIDVSRLTRGSGIFITEDMNLFGWKTRLEFIDACFNEMKVLVDDARHPANTIRQWQYAIRTGNIMDFFLPDADNTITYPDITLSIDNNNVIDEKIISSIDTSRLINAITVVSKDDETIYAQLEDMGSQEKYGVISYFLQYPSLDRNELEDVAYKILNQYRDPSITYTVSLTNTDNLDLGDIIKIDMPSLPSSAVKSIIEYDITFANTINARYKIGVPQVSISEYIDRLKQPTDR